MTLHLTKRSSLDLLKIQSDSINEWGEIVAEKYLSQLEDTLKTIEEYQNILRKNSKISNHFFVYPFKSHWLVFDKIDDYLILLTVRYARMDLETLTEHLAETLKSESKELHEMLRKSQNS